MPRADDTGVVLTKYNFHEMKGMSSNACLETKFTKGATFNAPQRLMIRADKFECVDYIYFADAFAIYLIYWLIFMTVSYVCQCF
jgi:hypothetical protein